MGPDRATVVVVENSNEEDNNNSVDEIKEYNGIIMTADMYLHVKLLEVYLGYDVHYMTPSVLRLPFHLPGQQQVVFGAEDDIENVINKTFVASSMFLAWMKCNEL
ncbi:hypothetical protein L6452_39485 [Arctium lappa]|uniref:Uncharacterized protein n=1 Tax=Arctium lappa TaxID=4217 RepID=A0ACB8XU41_ARCLA|nr:hypothetical protein L6452_39485 [Arctium lappa]